MRQVQLFLILGEVAFENFRSRSALTLRAVIGVARERLVWNLNLALDSRPARPRLGRPDDLMLNVELHWQLLPEQFLQRLLLPREEHVG